MKKFIFALFFMISVATLFPFKAAIVRAGEVTASLLESQKKAEAQGLIFEKDHDEIVAKAKKEGKLKFLSGLDPRVYSHMIASFNKNYPSIDVEMHEITGTDAAQRFVMELKSGGSIDFDSAHASTDFYPEYPRFAKKFDILGMAQAGVLKIPPKMVDPKHRTVVALGSAIEVAAYNKNLIAAEKVPDRWEDFLKPEFKGRKFVADVRPHVFASFPACPEEGLGQEWALKFARQIGAQKPIWFRGHSRALSAILAGEYPLHMATHYQSISRAMSKDPTGTLQLKIVEPVPLRLQNLELVLASAAHPYASLLFIEHQASPEGQDIIDKYEPLVGSVFSPGSDLARTLKNKKLCMNGFDTFHQSSKWMAMAVEAFGFPKPEKKR